jgi:hypothetical protein
MDHTFCAYEACKASSPSLGIYWVPALGCTASFCFTAEKHTLHEFQQIAGTINWLFNVFPLLKPGLSAVYNKMRDKSKLLA